MWSGPLEDRVAIRELYDAYSAAAFRSDVEAYLDCWAEEGLRVWAGRECCGKPALPAQWSAIWEGLERMTFFTQISRVEIDGEQAKAGCYGLEMLALKPSGHRTVVGRYEDVLVRRSGRWLFLRREYVLHLEG